MLVDANLLLYAIDTSAIEHGLELCSADTDFARFRELRWRNPISM